jgi:hypothetical protein
MSRVDDVPSSPMNPALEAVRRARAWCESHGDPRDFRAFEAFVLRSGDARTYQDVAVSMGTSVPDVRARVLRVRMRIRKELQALMGTQGPEGKEAREKP